MRRFNPGLYKPSMAHILVEKPKRKGILLIFPYDARVDRDQLGWLNPLLAN